MPTPQEQTPPTGLTAPYVPGQAITTPETVPVPSSAPVVTVPGYDILGELGRGGMGVVYKARDQKLGRIVALKMILVGGHAGEDALGRFRTEAEAIARLQHPHIVQIHEIGEHEGLPFITLEFCGGGTLAKKLSGTPLPPDEAARQTEVLARAMAAAHGKGVIHRDLKPANVLLAEDPSSPLSPVLGGEGLGVRGKELAPLAGLTLKITDFGLARKVDEPGQTVSGMVVGTPSYMAPEQARGQSQNLGPACDVYALGAILYECLTGRPPFRAATVMDTLVQVIHEEPVPPRQLNPRVPMDLETICLCCLRKEPTRRYASAADLAEDLRRFTAGEPIQARPVGRLERGWKWVKRNRAVTAAILALLVGSVASLMFGLQALAEAERADIAAKNADDRARAEEAATKVAQGETTRAENETKAKDAALIRMSENLVTAQLARVAAIADRDPFGALDLLHDVTACPIHLRGTAWRAHERRCSRWLLDKYSGHTSSVYSVAFSPDGHTLASRSHDNTIRLWDVGTGQERVSLKGHTSSVYSVAFSPDGRTLASGSDDKSIRLWDVGTGQERASFKGHTSNVQSVAFSPDGRTLASGSDDESIRLWDVGTGKERVSLKGHTDHVSSVAFSPDGRTLASGSHDSTIRLWDVGTGQERASLKGHTSWVLSVEFSPDGRTLASGSDSPGRRDPTIKLWDVGTGKERASLKGQRTSARSLAFSPDGRTLASEGDDNAIRLWDVGTGQERASFKGHTSWVLSVAFSPDGRTFASGGHDSTIRLWDVGTGKERASLKGHADFSVRSVAFSPDGRTLASGGDDDTIRLWDVGPGQERAALKGHSAVHSVAFSPDGRTLASGSGSPGSRDPTIKLWDVGTGQERASLKGHTEVHSVAFSPDGRTLASGSEDNTIRLWDVGTGQERASLKGHTRPVRSVAFSPDGRTLASGSEDDTIRLWDVGTGKERASLKGHTAFVMYVAFSPDGRHVVSEAADFRKKVWDVQTGQHVEEPREAFLWLMMSGPSSKPPGTSTVSPDGRLRAEIRGKDVWLIDLTWKPPALVSRPRYPQPDPDWHEQQVAACIEEKQFFAAAFHLGRLADLSPWETSLRLREAKAWTDAGQSSRGARAYLQAMLADATSPLLPRP